MAGDGLGLEFGRTIAAVDILLVERLLEIDGEGLSAAVAATVPCLSCSGRGLGL